jgi:hypothetical protein
MADEPVNNGDQRRDQLGRFGPGNGGRRVGSVGKATRLAQALLDDEGEALVRKAVELAKAGDTVCLKLLIERILPLAKPSRFVLIDLPAITTPGDLMRAASMIVERVAAGELDLDSVRPLVDLVEAAAQAAHAHDLDQRISALERYAERERLRVVR